jgi:hypothetical protein
MKQIFFASTMVCVLIILSCSKKSVSISETRIEKRPPMPIFINCEQSDYTGCEYKVWCFHDKVGIFSNLPSSAYLGNYKISQIVNCFVEVSNSKGELQELANSTLIQYYNAALERGTKRKPPKVLGGGVHSNNPDYKAFAEWNSKESFEIGLKFIEYRAIDCGGYSHGCKNLRFDFLNYVLLPKLSKSSQQLLLNEEYFDIIYTMGGNFGLKDVEKSDEILENYLKWFKEKWQSGKLKLKVEEEQESER